MALEQACQDLEDVAASLGEPINTMIGHSWGGAVVIIEGAKLRPQRVIAIDPMVRQVSAAWYDEFLEELHALFSLTGDERAARVREEFAHWHEIDIDGKIHAIATMTTRPIERLRDENPASGWNLRDVLASYPIPLLLIMADPEESIAREPDLADVRARGGSNVQIVTLDGHGHNLHRTGFDQFADKLDAMMEDGGHALA